MRHHGLKAVVCGRRSFFGCMKIPLALWNFLHRELQNPAILLCSGSHRTINPQESLILDGRQKLKVFEGCGFLEASQHNNALEIYKVFKVIKKEFNEILINNFNLIKKGQIISCSGEKEQFAEEDFTAVLVNEESYKDVLCLACKKVFCQSL